jgi:hypothetical protein
LCGLIPTERAVLIFVGISVIYDGIAFLITIVYSIRNVISVRSTLMTRIFVDGVIYFIVIFTYNLLWFIWILSVRVRCQHIFCLFFVFVVC